MPNSMPDMQQWSDLITVMLRYGGFFGMLITLIVGTIYTVAWLYDRKAAKGYPRKLRQLWAEAQWATVKLLTLGAISLMAFASSW